MSRISVLKSSDKYEDISIVRQRYQQYKEFFSPPPIEVPSRDYSQRSEKSGLPIGEFIPNSKVPLGESIAQFSYRLSREANEAWRKWTEVHGEAFAIDNQMYDPIDKPVEQYFLTEEEYVAYVRVKRLVIVEQGRFQQKYAQRAQRLLSESNNRHYYDQEAPEVYNGSNRYFDTIVSVTGELGNVEKIEKTVDRCNGNTKVKRISGVSIPDVELVTATPSYDERLYYANYSHYQTSVWRAQYRKDADLKYFSNSVEPDDDPDFINPSSFSSRNFIVYPPASRPYNCVFLAKIPEQTVVLKDGSKKHYKAKIHIIYPKDKTVKDYTTVSGIEYLLSSKGIKYDWVRIHDIKIKDNTYPNCKFEPDIRVTFAPDKDQLPDFGNYKRVNSDSVTGKKVLQLLNEQPHLWKELYLSSEEGKKLVVYYSVYSKEKNTHLIFWTYVDTNKSSLGKPRALRKKVVLPQTTYHYMQTPGYHDLPNFLRRRIPIAATVRMSSNCYYFSKTKDEMGREKTNIVGFKEIEASFLEYMDTNDYKFIKVANESPYSNILNYHFVHVSALTKEQRKTLYLQLLKDKDVCDS